MFKEANEFELRVCTITLLKINATIFHVSIVGSYKLILYLYGKTINVVVVVVDTHLSLLTSLV